MEMSLIKKTFVLSDGKPKGYLTVVRVGNDGGVKIVGESFVAGMKAYVKIGGESQIVILTGKRTEAELNITVGQGDGVGCVVYDEKEIVASGGKEISDREKRNLLEPVAVISEQPVFSAPPARPQSDDTVLSEDPTQNRQTSDNKTEERDETVDEKGGETDEVTGETGIGANEKSGEENEQGDEEREMLSRLGEEKSGYYIGISDKIDELFVVYPQERLLMQAIPDSEWVKVTYDGEDYYVVGKLREDGKVRYLGYGVPGKANVKPPKVADGIADWFPLENPDGYDGYWLFFQDAETGKIDG